MSLHRNGSNMISKYFKPLEENRPKMKVSANLKSNGILSPKKNENQSITEGLRIFSLTEKKRKPPMIADDSDEEEAPDRVLRDRKQAHPSVVVELSDDDDDAMEEEMVITSRKRKVIQINDDDDDDDDDDRYMDENEEKNKLHDNMPTSKKMDRLAGLFPQKSHHDIMEVLKANNYKAVEAAAQLGKDDTPSLKQRKRLKLRADYDEDDESSMEQARAREDLEQTLQDEQVLRFFNTATSPEIQEVTLCSPDAAEKVIELRPFDGIVDLESRLKSEKGVSVNFVASFKTMQEGYEATDCIIQQVEHIGHDLGRILDVWKGEMTTASSRQGSPDSNDIEDEKAGTHITALSDTIDKTSDIYMDAMDGYLTTQPAFVNPEMTLKDYQIMGVNWMLLLYRKNISGILADEMGLGKTAQVISFLARLYELGDEGLHLVVVPSSTIENWVREFSRFAPKLEVRTYHGSQAERAALRAELLDEYDDYQVIVTTYNIATSNENDRLFLKRLNCQTMILDEGHMVKNCFSARYQNLKKIRAPFRLLLTGTPLQNSLQELISLLTFIMPETFDQFKDKLQSVFKVKSSSSKDTQMLSRQRIQRAKQMMTPFVLRRRKLDVLKDLPQKLHVQEHCTMTHEQQKLYHAIVRDSKKTYQESQKEYTGLSNIMVHLRKAADHPMLFRNLYDDGKIKVMAKEILKDVRYWDSEEQYVYEDMTVMSDFELNRLCLDHKVIKHHALEKRAFMDSGKVKMLVELLKKYKHNKVLIFSQFTKMLDILEVVLKQVETPYLRLDGETKVMERQAVIDQFNDDKEIPVFLLSTKAGGFGINLTSANIVILFDMDFNPQNDKQAEDRAHRVGQTQDVTIIRLISKNSIEEYILKLADIKLRLDKSISEADGEVDTETEKKNLRELLQNEFNSVE